MAPYTVLEKVERGMKDFLHGALIAMCIWLILATFYNSYEIDKLGKEMSEQLKREAVLMEAITLVRLNCLHPRVEVWTNFGPYFPKGYYVNPGTVTNLNIQSGWTNSILKP